MNLNGICQWDYFPAAELRKVADAIRFDKSIGYGDCYINSARALKVKTVSLHNYVHHFLQNDFEPFMVFILSLGIYLPGLAMKGHLIDPPTPHILS